MIDRLEQILKEYGLSPSRFADKMGVQRSGISHILAGRNKPSYDFMVKFAEEFPEVDITWLLTGKGTMFSDGKDPEMQEASQSTKSGATSEPVDLFSSIPKEPVKKVVQVTESSDKEEKEPSVNDEEQAVYISKHDKSRGEIDSILVLFSDGRFKRYVGE